MRFVAAAAAAAAAASSHSPFYPSLSSLQPPLPLLLLPPPHPPPPAAATTPRLSASRACTAPSSPGPASRAPTAGSRSRSPTCTCSPASAAPPRSQQTPLCEAPARLHPPLPPCCSPPASSLSSPQHSYHAHPLQRSPSCTCCSEHLPSPLPGNFLPRGSGACEPLLLITWPAAPPPPPFLACLLTCRPKGGARTYPQLMFVVTFSLFPPASSLLHHENLACFPTISLSPFHFCSKTLCNPSAAGRSAPCTTRPLRVP